MRETNGYDSINKAVERDNEIERKTKIFYRRKRQLREIIKQIERGLEPGEAPRIVRIGNEVVDTLPPKERKQFIRQCPSNDCKGFLSQNLKCGLCGIWACGECREIKGDTQNAEHTCDPQIVENVKALKSETKPCPKCAAPIFSLGGCNQFWCRACHVAFNWQTGKIETGRIHNPEYFRYLRETQGHVPRETEGGLVDAGPCGGNRQIRERDIVSMRDPLIQEILRNILHIKNVELRKFVVNITDETNRDVRVDYMLNKIDDKKLRKLVVNRATRNDKKQEIHDILDMYIQCMTDIFFNLYNRETNLLDTHEFLTQAENLRKYVNDCFQDVSKTYNSIAYKVGDVLFNLVKVN